MKLVMLGAPGTGKGTQGVRISKDLNIPNISTGDILRKAVSEETKLGIEAKQYMDQGKLVPDELIIGIVDERIREKDCENGFILDGFPRTVPQAQALDEILKATNDNIDFVLELVVGREQLVKRLTSRRVCESCGKVYNVISNPPPADSKCEACGGNIIQRSDDSEETVVNRLKIYEEKTKPLKEYYTAQDKLKEFDGNGTVEDVERSIREFLEHK